jgi:hypothetical protein
MPTTLPPRFLHDMKNHLAIVLGFSELLLGQLAEDHPMRADLMEIHEAAQEAVDLCQAARDADAEALAGQ